MLNGLKFTEDWRCFKAGDTFTFRPGVNLLVGDQGCGKSSLLQAIAAVSHAKRYKYPYELEKKVAIDSDKIQVAGFDFELNSLRGRESMDNANFKTQLAMILSSHGQSNLAILNALKKEHDTVFFL